MKFVELKCKNCGAKLEVEEGTTQVTCKFCDTTFSIDDAYTQGYKYKRHKMSSMKRILNELRIL